LSNLFTPLASLFDKISPLKFFIVTASFFGLLFLLLTPPFQGADEPVHFQRAYQISEGNFVIDKFGSNAGGYLPKSIDDTIDLVATHPRLEFKFDKKYNIYKTSEGLSYSLSPQKRDKQIFSATSVYTPVSYITSASSIFVGRILGLSPLALLYFGRLADLTVWVVLLSLAIYLMPRKKWALVFVGLLPMCLFQAATVNADVMSIGLAAVFIASILRFMEKDKTHPIGLKQALYLLALATAMVLSKQIMFVLLPLVLLIPSARFKIRNSIWIKIAIILIPVLLLGWWMYFIRGIDVTGSFTNRQNPSEQLHFIAHNPHSFINVIWNTYFFNWGDSVTRSFIGTFGWSDAPLSEFIVAIAYIAFFLILTINNNAKTWLSKNQKLFILVIGIVYWLAVSAALYIYYSPVEFKVIFGLQGRYFIPLALLAIPVFYGNLLKASPKTYKRIATLTPLFLLTASVITIYVRYYINNV
jgi:uncharacterized membrane protein